MSTFIICAGMMCAAGGQIQQTTALILTKTIPMPNVEGRIDHMAVDVAEQRLFVAALGNNTVEVLDLKRGKHLQSLSGFAEPQGIAYVSHLDRLFVANGQDGTCRILNAHTLKTISSVLCGDDADNVRYDGKNERIYVGYGRGALAVLDARTGQKLGDIKLAGHPESFRLETNGNRIFVNVPNADSIAVVDCEKQQVLGTWSLKEAKSNFPLFLDEINHRLFSGCRHPARILVYDFGASTGRLVTSIPISSDIDDLFYDVSNKLLYASCGQGNIDIIEQTDADHYSQIQTISTAAGARTSLFIPELKFLCVAVPHRGTQKAEIRVFRTK